MIWVAPKSNDKRRAKGVSRNGGKATVKMMAVWNYTAHEPMNA